MNVDPKRPVHKNTPPSGGRLIFALIGSERAPVVDLQALLSSLHDIALERVPGVEQLAAALQRGAPKPDLLMIDVNPDNPEDLATLRQLRKTSGLEHVPIIALTDRETAHAPLRAMRAGADDVLLKPVGIEEAREVLARVLDRPRPTRTAGGTLGKAVVFMHLSGGVGATTLAVNSACALAAIPGARQTCLFDLDIQFGNAASLLDLTASSPVQEFVDDPTRLDEAMLEGMMQRHLSGLKVLTAPRELLPLNSYSAEGLRHLIELAKRHFGHIILDLPVALAPWTEAVLKEAAVIYLVTSTTVPSAHRLMKFLELLQHEGVRDLPFRIVVNRYHRAHKNANDISLSQFEKAVKRSVDFTIPNDYSLISLSHGQGRPAIGLKPNSPFTVALNEMLAADLGKTAVTQTKRGFFLFGRN